MDDTNNFLQGPTASMDELPGARQRMEEVRAEAAMTSRFLGERAVRIARAYVAENGGGFAFKVTHDLRGIAPLTPEATWLAAPLLSKGLPVAEVIAKIGDAARDQGMTPSRSDSEDGKMTMLTLTPPTRDSAPLKFRVDTAPDAVTGENEKTQKFLRAIEFTGSTPRRVMDILQELSDITGMPAHRTPSSDGTSSVFTLGAPDPVAARARLVERQRAETDARIAAAAAVPPPPALEQVADFFRAHKDNVDSYVLVHLARPVSKEERGEGDTRDLLVIQGLDTAGSIVRDADSDREAARAHAYKYTFGRHGDRRMLAEEFAGATIDMRDAAPVGRAQELPKAHALKARAQGDYVYVQRSPSTGAGGPAPVDGVHVKDTAHVREQFIAYAAFKALYGQEPPALAAAHSVKVFAFKDEKPFTGLILEEDKTLLFTHGPVRLRAGSMLYPNAAEEGGFSVVAPEDVRLHFRRMPRVAAAAVAAPKAA